MLLWLALLLASAGARAAGPAIDRIEPPFWWAGMASPRLQLLVHGPRIAEFTPSLQHPGVQVTGVQRVASPNYLFIDLALAPEARPGTLALRFTRGADVLAQAYELRARRAGSAQRRGFSSADVILNLVPDRFANGDPGNDTIAGYPDPVNRADIGAGRHGGDLQGIAQHLDYIAGLGFTMLWPTPLVENKQARYSYHGYAATDLYRIDPRFGSNEDYRRLVTQGRARGLGMIQDVVLNHIGSGHWWMADLPSADWLTMGGRFVATRHARTAVSDPYAAQDDRDNFTQGWFEPEMPDLNQRQPLLATYLTQNAIWWIEYADLAGLRVDTFGYSDAAFLARFTQAVMAEYPQLNLVGEEWSGNPAVVARWQRGRTLAPGLVSQLPSLMDFPLHYVLRRALLSEEAWNGGFTELYEALVNDTLYTEPMNMVLFEGNHDVPRLHSALGGDLALTKMALAYVLTMRGIPQLYYGTELLMTSPTQRDDGATRQDFPGGWPGDAVNAVTGAGLTPEQREAQDFVRRLMNWRKHQRVIHHGRLTHYAPENGTYVYFRHDGPQQVMVAFNKRREAVTLDTRRFHERLAPDAQGTEVLSGRRLDLSRTLELPPRSVLVIELR
ncbi:MAG: glycoside hydrolase family 13 protein [Burkholderiales bacterium]|nr:glycoside hydrolase family 13 protein [Burkholderiales bacterium]